MRGLEVDSKSEQFLPIDSRSGGERGGSGGAGQSLGFSGTDEDRNTRAAATSLSGLSNVTFNVSLIAMLMVLRHFVSYKCVVYSVVS